MARMPQDFDTYIEPFAGAACLVFSLKPRRFVLGDVNSRLIEFYTALRDRPAELHARYCAWQRNPETYYRLRAEFNAGGPSLQRAAQFLYLNRHCYNGIFRVNAKGEFNVPWGGDKSGEPPSLARIEAASAQIGGTDLVCGDFAEVISNDLSERSFVYSNPPYSRKDARVFREYDRDGFGREDWDRLIAVLERIDRSGARFLLSYATDDRVAERLAKWTKV